MQDENPTRRIEWEILARARERKKNNGHNHTKMNKNIEFDDVVQKSGLFRRIFNNKSE